MQYLKSALTLATLALSATTTLAAAPVGAAQGRHFQGQPLVELIGEADPVDAQHEAVAVQARRPGQRPEFAVIGDRRPPPGRLQVRPRCDPGEALVEAADILLVERCAIGQAAVGSPLVCQNDSRPLAARRELSFPPTSGRQQRRSAPRPRATPPHPRLPSPMLSLPPHPRLPLVPYPAGKFGRSC